VVPIDGHGNATYSALCICATEASRGENNCIQYSDAMMSIAAALCAIELRRWI